MAAREEDEEAASTFRILVTTDNHLGYLEKDVLRRNDSLQAFEEVLSIAKEQKVDMILQGGDLFHENKPSRHVLHRTMELLRRYCMGDEPIRFEILSDQAVNFGSNSFPVVNYEDPNYNVSIPMFLIHGNHDDPAGEGNLCALNLLSVANLVNYFGKPDDIEDISISPILMKKGSTKIALYGLGSIRDERLHRLFMRSKVKYLQPKEQADDWFNLFMLHQNRVVHGAHNYIPENFLPSFLDLVIWGHEHECLIDPTERRHSGDDSRVFIMQPGSSVATSLCEGEMKQKHVAILSVKETDFRVEKIPLKSVRPYIFSTIDLADSNIQPELEDEVMSHVSDEVRKLIARVPIDFPEANGKLPLIRLRVNYAGGYTPFSVLRFGQRFVNEVANPTTLLNFFKRRAAQSLADTRRTAGEEEAPSDRRLEASTKDVSDILIEQLQKDKPEVLSEDCLAKALDHFVEKEETDAITDVVKYCVQRTQHLLQQRANSVDMMDHVITRHRDDLKRQQEAAWSSRLSSGNQRQQQSEVEVSLLSSDDDEGLPPAPPPSRRGRGRGRGTKRTLESATGESSSKKKRSEASSSRKESSRGRGGRSRKT
ncbi:double-strand break repair protein MRE11-like [Dysidea avara]|uniref:double-strand break repair protein MRE11-like n=1 Tax=Dysidea avara TaxID=196820 RepID=UPI00331D69FA